MAGGAARIRRCSYRNCAGRLAGCVDLVARSAARHPTSSSARQLEYTTYRGVRDTLTAPTQPDWDSSGASLLRRAHQIADRADRGNRRNPRARHQGNAYVGYQIGLAVLVSVIPFEAVDGLGARIYRVPAASMRDTVMEGDFIVADSWPTGWVANRSEAMSP